MKDQVFYNPAQHQNYLVFIRKLKKSFSMCVIHNNVHLWNLWAVCIKSLKNVPNCVVDASLIIQTFDSTIWRPSFNSKKVRYIRCSYFDVCTYKKVWYIHFLLVEIDQSLSWRKKKCIMFLSWCTQCKVQKHKFFSLVHPVD